MPDLRSGRAVALVLAASVASAGCEGTHDLATKNCLPLKAPVKVVLLQEAGLYASPNNALPFLQGHPRSTANDAFREIKLIAVLRPGATLDVQELTQRWGFDSGPGRISAIGITPDGQKFEYGWGAGTTIGRAPWEPGSTPNLRTVRCGN